MSWLLNPPYLALAVRRRVCTRARNTANSLVDLKETLPLVTHVMDVTLCLVKRLTMTLTVVPLLMSITDAWNEYRCLFIRMTGSAEVQRLSLVERQVF